jgi:hypothetical protein
MRFSQEARRQIDDEDNRGLNCHGCLFSKARAEVCNRASEAAQRMNLRDCDAVDQFGEVVIYVKYREIQRDFIDEGRAMG